LGLRRQSLPSVIQIQPVVYIKSETKCITQVNKYVLLKKIGTGASSKIYVTLDTKTQNYYATKVFKPVYFYGDPIKAMDHFEREIRILWKFHHENILGAHEALYSETNSTAYIVLEWADCGSLEQYATPTNPLHLSEIAAVIIQVVRGVMHLHEKGYAHKDIKPSNILLFSNGTAKISDFGIGHTFQSAESVVGTPAYQAPEVYGDDENYDDYDEDVKIAIDPIKEDVWSLGVTLYQLAFCRLPFTGNNQYEIARNARESILQYDKSVPGDLVDLLRGMLEVDPEKRFSMEQVARHRFFNNACEKDKLKFPAMKPPKIDSEVSIRRIDAKVCTSLNIMNFKAIPNPPPSPIIPKNTCTKRDVMLMLIVACVAYIVLSCCSTTYY
jgi:serine/threonine-protein kinase 11